ncbi:hypothetical protein MNB_SV-5-328 [hydrothermal vent metagenome]|uniref:Uncharacterized protein n=1 Tax=hydrothermal vent metagenome TaxID=652676 RepID=A0A1W1EFY0_9ZZZZ
MDNLETLKAKSMNLYLDYRSNVISENKYLEKIKELDEAIEEIEMNFSYSKATICDELSESLMEIQTK